MRTHMPDECRGILKRTGAALMIFGAIDIAVMAYSIAHQVNYSSSLNIFAVLAGVCVWMGYRWWVKWVARAVAFYIAAYSVIALMLPFIFPMDLAMAEVRPLLRALRGRLSLLAV